MRRLTLPLLALGLSYAALLWLAGHVGPVLTTADRLLALTAFLVLMFSAARLLALLTRPEDAQ